MRPDGGETRDGENGTPGESLHYEAPAIEWEEPLEAVARFAAACDKSAMGDTQCVMGFSATS